MAATTTANEAIKDRLDDFLQFHPANVNLFSGWMLDPGDIVTIKEGEAEYKVPIYTMDVNWKGESRVQLQSTGKEKRPPLSALKRNSYAAGRREEEMNTRFIQDENKIGMVVEVRDGENVIKAAQIVAAINDSDETEAIIDADHVYISGDTKLSGWLTIDGGALVVKGPITAYGSGSYQPIMGNLAVPSSGQITFIGSDPNERYQLSTALFKNFIKEASVSGNVLTLTPVYGNAITFSKATTLTGAWSSGNFPLTVSASPQGETYDIGFGSYGSHDIDLELVANGSASVSSSAYSIDVPLAIKSLNSGQTAPTPRYTKTLTVAVGSLLESKTGANKITANGTYTASSADGKIGFSSVEVDVSGGSIPPSSHIQVESNGHYSPSYSAGGTQITSWVSTIKTAVQNNGYFYFDSWLTDNPNDKKRYYIKFS